MSHTLTNYAPLITALESKISHASSVLVTATVKADIISYSKILNYAEASLAMISNEQVLETATATPVISSASAAVDVASETLSSLVSADNLYGLYPSRGGNLALAVVMAIFFVCHNLIALWARTWWFGISYFCGVGLEFAGYIGRTLSHNDPTSIDYFLLQFTTLTLAPVFIMAGIYYLLAQFVLIYGREFSILKPLLYSLVFISCDVISLVIQAAGAAIAADSLSDYESGDLGTHIMVGGLAFQVVSMSVFIFFLSHFLYRIEYFRPEQQRALEHRFNPKYAHIRQAKLFKWFPAVTFLAVIFVYVRCIYRVIELSEGWSGFLITHEIYIFILDAMMICLSIVLFIPFHPGIVYAKKTVVRLQKEVTTTSLVDQDDDGNSQRTLDHYLPKKEASSEDTFA